MQTSAQQTNKGILIITLPDALMAKQSETSIRLGLPRYSVARKAQKKEAPTH